MDISDEILEHAMKHFDDAGIVAVESGAVLIMGLEHSKERNLDSGVVEHGRFRNTVWSQFAKPGMTALIDFIEARDFKAESLGRHGYPGGGVMSLKHMAVVAGLGLQGKNTVILHPKFGHRLRLAALWTDAPLTATGPGVREYKEHPLCKSCNICIDACPVEGVLEPYRLAEPSQCLCNLDSIVTRERQNECREACRRKCPVGQE